MAIVNTEVHYNLAFDGGIIVQPSPVYVNSLHWQAKL